MTLTVEWRGQFTNAEVNALHAEAFETRLFDDNWLALTERWSLGWVVARDALGLAGFVNVLTDGGVHSWLQDTMVAARVARQGVGAAVVAAARTGSSEAGCEHLHVDFGPELAHFYVNVCGFTQSTAGVMQIRP